MALFAKFSHPLTFLICLMLVALNCNHGVAVAANADTEWIIQWAKRNGIDHSSVLVSSFKKGDSYIRGLAAAHDIKEGELVLRVPFDLLIRNSNRIVGPQCDSIRFKPDLAYYYDNYVALLHHRQLGQASHYYEYMQSLPTLDDFKKFYPYAAGHEITKDFVQLPFVSEYVTWAEGLADMLDTIAKSNSNCFKTLPTFEDAMWAECIASTRQWEIDGHLMMSPLMDFVNTPVDPEDEENLGMEEDPAEKEVRFRALRDIQKGEELTHDYVATSDHGAALDAWGILKPEGVGPEVQQLSRQACQELEPGIHKYLQQGSELSGICKQTSIAGCNLARVSVMFCRDVMGEL